MTYNWETDAKLSWLEAIKEIRRRRLLSGQSVPCNDDERQWLNTGGQTNE